MANLLAPGRIKIPLGSSDKDGVIQELCDVLAAQVGADDEAREDIRRAVFARESVLSTGVGGGVALPHGKSEAVEELTLVAGVTDQDIDFDAIDQKPVRLVLLLVGPESAASEHVKVLSKIGRVMRRSEVRDALVESESAEAFYDALVAAEGGAA